MAEKQKKNPVEPEVTATEPVVETPVETEPIPDPIETLQKELDECKDHYLRTAAEYENFRKRTAREREGLFADGSACAVRELLSVYDNLERALAQPTEDDAYRKGIELTFTQLVEALERLKVTPISPLGEPFDPNLHNAVMHIEDESVGEETVVEVFQTGFRLGDRIIRHAMVKVAN